MTNQILFSDGPFDIVLGNNDHWYIRELHDGGPAPLLPETFFVAQRLGYSTDTRPLRPVIERICKQLNEMVERGELVQIGVRYVPRRTEE